MARFGTVADSHRPPPLSQTHLDRTARIQKLAAAAGGPRAIPPPSNQQAHRNILALDPKEITRISRANVPTSSRVSSGLPIRSPPPPPPGHSGSSSRVQGRKRPIGNNAGDEDEDEDEYEDHDDEYETNDRPVDERRRIAMRNSITRQPRAKRARTAESAPMNGGRRSVSVAHSSRPHAREDELEEREGSEELEADDIPVLSQQVKAAIRLARERVSRPPQKRVFWSGEDTKKLIVAIPKYNCAWSQMEEEGLGLSTARTQQAIRDKARNVKVDLLKADRPLFAGFDGVALSKKEKLAVIAMGRNPDRTESDVGEDGAVINNIWIPEDDEGL